MLIAVYVGVIAGVLIAVCLIVRMVLQMDVLVTIGKNDNQTPKLYLTRILSAARDKIIIFDDGNDMADSIYNDADVVDAFVKKLEQSPDFTVKCYFNCSDRTLFRESLEERPGVEIQSGNSLNRSGSEVHYKISDDGKMGYLSMHEAESSSRSYKFVDCSTIKRSRLGFALASKDHFGPYLKDFGRRFKRLPTSP